MFCKYCGHQVDDNAKFCSFCGNSIFNDSKDEILESTERVAANNFEREESENKEQPLNDGESMEKASSQMPLNEPFWKLSNDYFCSYCGTKIGNEKSCPECHNSRNIKIHNYCKYCGGKVENNRCNNSGVATKSNILEKILRIATIFTIILYLLSAAINIISGDGISLPIVLTMIISAFSIVFIISKRQIYKIKVFLTEKKIHTILICVIYVAIILAIILSSSINTKYGLDGDDLAAYELIAEVSYEFKNPSSVRLVSGSVFYNEEYGEYCGWFALSATNGYGATTVGYYFVDHLDGEIFALDLEEYGDDVSIVYAKTRDELDVNAINKALDKKWGK